MAGIAMGISVAASLINGIVAYKNGMAQAEAANINARIADNNAAAVRLKGVQEQDRILSNGKQQISKQLVAALQGGSMGGGTSENAIAKSVYNLKTDLTNTAYNYETEAIGFLNESKLQKYYGKMYRQNAAAGLAGGVLGAAASVLSMGGGSAIGTGATTTGATAVRSGLQSYAQSLKPMSLLNSASKLSLFAA